MYSTIRTVLIALRAFIYFVLFNSAARRVSMTVCRFYCSIVRQCKPRLDTEHFSNFFLISHSLRTMKNLIRKVNLHLMVYGVIIARAGDPVTFKDMCVKSGRELVRDSNPHHDSFNKEATSQFLIH